MALCLWLDLTCLDVSSADAQVYRWQDENGVVHYSSKPAAKGAERAELPAISRGEVKVPPSLLQGCADHGGVSCAEGADTDGSVICLDGFKGSHQRFRASCGSPKLEIAEISRPDRNGRFTVSLRNLNSAPAREVTIVFSIAADQKFDLEGAREIESFGTAEFVFDPATYEKHGVRMRHFSEPPAQDRFIVGCGNCR